MRQKAKVRADTDIDREIKEKKKKNLIRLTRCLTVTQLDNEKVHRSICKPQREHGT